MHLLVQKLSIIAGDSRLTDTLLFGIIVRMFESRPVRRVDVAHQRVVAASQELTGIYPAALSGDELLDLLDRLEADTRRRTAVAGRLIAELHARGTAGELGYSSNAVLLSERLRIGRREAAGRVRLAADLAPRRAMSGEQLEPRFPLVAWALADGKISPGTRRSSAPPSTDSRTEWSSISRTWSPMSNQPCSNTPNPRPGTVGRAGPPGDRLPEPRRRARHRPRPGPAPRRHPGDAPGWVGPAHRNPHQPGGRRVDDRARHTQLPMPTETEPDRRTPGQRRHDAL